MHVLIICFPTSWEDREINRHDESWKLEGEGRNWAEFCISFKGVRALFYIGNREPLKDSEKESDMVKCVRKCIDYLLY